MIVQIKSIAAETKDRNIPFKLDESEVKKLIERVTNKTYADRFEFEKIPASSKGLDEFEITDLPKGKILIRATGGIAAANAFNWYLTNRCNSYVGPLNIRMEYPKEPPKINGVIKEKSKFLYRYLFNYCTFGYTMPFWQWSEWEQFLDWILLSGYNLVLNPIGHEEVWRQVLTTIGYSSEEIGKLIAGPAYTPWQWMMNMTGWGGPPPAWWYQDRVELSQKISTRLRKFGVSIMLPGYSGMVPLDFGERFSDAKLIDQGSWCGFKRPPILLPEDKMFNTIADLFYKIQKSIFGNEYCHYYSTDPFHEGGNTEGMDLPKYADLLMKKMLEHDENAVWFFQGWQDNPRREMLNVLDKGHVLVGNLSADANIDGGDNFANSPWLYCTVNNFGGQRLLRGNVINSLTRPHKLQKDNNYAFVGIGYMPEAIVADEVFFDIISHISIKEEQPTLDEWLCEYIRIRYGSYSSNLYNAWKILCHSVYISDGICGPRESGLCSRPSLSVDRVSTWGSPQFNYDRDKLIEATKLILSEYDNYHNIQTYRFDLTDCLRQCVADLSWDYIDGIKESYANKDSYALRYNADQLLNLFDLQESLVSTNQHMLLGKWLDMAKRYGKTPAEKALFEFNARTQITLWGDRSGSVELHDYAAKEWSGLLADFYKPRWEAFIGLLLASLETGCELCSFEQYDYEAVFCFTQKEYSCEPKGNLKEIALKIIEHLK